MITVYPHESDWDHIAQITGDDSWRARRMRKYFDRIERAQYRDGSIILDLLEPGQAIADRLRRLTASAEGEGARGERGAGWLAVTQADPKLLLDDVKGVLPFVAAAFHVAKRRGLDAMPGWNPNHPAVAEGNRKASTSSRSRSTTADAPVLASGCSRRRLSCGRRLSRVRRWDASIWHSRRSRSM